jgi:hypothetical protein
MGSLQLRNILRRVNTEYSALVRDGAATDRSARLARLKTEREKLMQLLASSAPPLRLVGSLPIPMSASGTASAPGVSTHRN